MVRFYTIVAALSVAAGGIVEAQGTGGGVAVPQSPQAPVPEVSVTARGEVTMAPDKARVQLGVETRAKTAAVAAQENARRQGGC